MNTTVKILTAVAVLLAAATTFADPLPGQILKFQQKPMDGVTINGVQYWGHDEESTAWSDDQYVYQGVFMADDFSDTVRQDVVHVKWWGSYFWDGIISDQQGVRKFLIGFEHDIPADPLNPESYSMPVPYHPENVYQIVQKVNVNPTPAGTFTENWVPSPVQRPEELYVYNAELTHPFPQKPDTVYWLKIVALLDDSGTEPPIPWGWHNRDYTATDPYASPNVNPGEHIQGRIPDPTGLNPTPIYHHQDDAVMGWTYIFVDPGTTDNVFVEQYEMWPTHYVDGWDGPGMEPDIPDFPGIGMFSKDLAFELYAIPEPSSIVLIGLGTVCLLAIRRRRR